MSETIRLRRVNPATFVSVFCIKKRVCINVPKTLVYQEQNDERFNDFFFLKNITEKEKMAGVTKHGKKYNEEENFCVQANSSLQFLINGELILYWPYVCLLLEKISFDPSVGFNKKREVGAWDQNWLQHCMWHFLISRVASHETKRYLTITRLFSFLPRLKSFLQFIWWLHSDTILAGCLYTGISMHSTGNWCGSLAVSYGIVLKYLLFFCNGKT
ncbi:hypothetical protein EDC94DRAFT_653806 [Helicostylum pulchrum]|nr:hypothetical protein EDC94DRAFT_653806 [Helicostylum pulchrum]